MSITQGLHRSLQQNPDRIETICGSRQRGVREVYDRVARLAGGLRELGLRRGERIAVAGLNSDHYAEVLLAAAWSGAPFVPLNSRWSVAELAYSLNDSGSRMLVVDDAFVAGVSELRALCPGIEAVVLTGQGSAPAGVLRAEDLIAQSSAVDDVFVDSGEVAGIFYTGGTTGHPKGVMLSHSNLTTAALGALATGDFMEQGGVAMHVAPMFHLAGIWPWVSAMLTGGTHVFIPAFDSDAVIDAVHRNDVADVLLVPTMIQSLVTRLCESGGSLPSLRHLIYAGAPMPEALIDGLQHVLPGVRLVQGYGMTELAPVATMLAPDDHQGRWRRSAGRPAPHSMVRIVDEAGVVLPSESVGEITVRGGQVMVGYWNNPDLTAQVLRDGWMHTGDVGFMDGDGFVYVVDRLKDMIITGGENVYSAEVENALMSHPGVHACAVIGVPDSHWGERVHAVIVAAQDCDPILEEIQSHLSEKIARYKIPKSIDVVDELPISAAGKILKRELRRERVGQLEKEAL